MSATIAAPVMSAVVASKRDTLLRDAASAFRVTDTAKVTRGATLYALKGEGMTEPQVAAALGKIIGSDAPSRATVGFYVRTYALYLQVDVSSPVVFGEIWSVVTRGKGITDDDVTAVIVPKDGPATRKAIAALVAERKAAAAEEAKAAKGEAKGNEAIAEHTAAGAAPLVAGRDYAAIVVGLVEGAKTPEARKRLAVALANGLALVNAAEVADRASKRYVA